VDAVREDPVRKGLLFAGTETGVWVSFDDGDHWQSLQLNLPHTSMRDLAIHDNDLIVATHGRSFWMLDDITPLRQVDGRVLESGAVLLKPGAAYRVRRNTNTDTPLPPDEPAGENPPDGAIIDFWLSAPPKTPVTLEILDTSGKTVRKYSSTDQPEQETPDKLPIPPWWVEVPKTLPATAGLHRWVWDLHYKTPDSLRHEYPISAVPDRTPRHPLGPHALPGEYTVKLTVGSRSYTAPLTLRMDPRVKTAAADLRQMFDVQARLAALMTRSTKAVRQARSAAEQLPQQESALGAKVKAELSPQSESSLLSVAGQIAALYGAVDSADAAPTDAEMKAAAKLSSDFESAWKRWTAIVDSIRATNPGINLEKTPADTDDDDTGDDDVG
jgi:hypothetical protein